MYERRRIIDTVWFKVAVVVLAVALAASFLMIYQKQEREKYAERQIRTAECEQELAPLRQQRKELAKQISDLDIRLHGADLNLGSVMILYTQPFEKIVNDTLPKLQEYGYPGMVCCKTDMFPGDPDCLTREQALELIESGWEFGLLLSPEDDVAELCHEMADRGLPAPAFAYYPLSDFDSEDPAQEQLLKDQGITTVLQYNFLPKDNDAHQLQYLAAYGFRERDCKTVLRSTVENSRALAFSVGFSNAYEQYEKRPFESMTSLFQNSVEENHLMVTTSSKALERRDEFTATLDERQAPLTAERDECKQRLAELDQEIVRVYQRYISE